MEGSEASEQRQPLPIGALLGDASQPEEEVVLLEVDGFHLG
jgi:hypothetical protein